jgi:hypothetical protein
MPLSNRLKTHVMVIEICIVRVLSGPIYNMVGLQGQKKKVSNLLLAPFKLKTGIFKIPTQFK